MNHLILISGLGSSVPFLRLWFRAWAKLLLKRLPAYGPTNGVRVWEVSSDGSGEKGALAGLLEDYRFGKLGKVVIAGHSNGARDALFIAEVLFGYGIKVQYLASLDMTLAEFGAKAFGNIQFLDEFHAKLETVDFDPSFQKSAANYRKWEIEGGHVGMASSETVQKRLAQKIKEVLG